MKNKKTILTLTLFSLAVLGVGFSLAPSLRKANFTPGESKSDLELSDGSGSASKKQADADDNPSLSETRHSEATPSVRENRQEENENAIIAVSSNGKSIEQNKTRAVSEKRERENNDDGTSESESTHEGDQVFPVIGGTQNHLQRKEGKASEVSSKRSAPGEKKTLTELEKWRTERKKKLAKLPPKLRKYHMERDAAFNRTMGGKWWTERRNFKNIFTKNWNREYEILVREFYDKRDSILDRYIGIYRNNHGEREPSEIIEEERNELRILARSYLEKLKSRTDWEEYQRYVKIRNNFLRETNEERKKYKLHWHLFF